MAVELGFPNRQQQGRVSQGARGAQQPQQQDLGLQSPTGIHLDEGAQYEELFRLYGTLRDFAAQMRARGIDVTGAPDPNVPGSERAVAEWNRAHAEYAKYLEKFQQSKQNMDLLQEGSMNGEIFVDGTLLNRQGLVSQEDTVRYQVDQDPQWLKTANTYMEETMETQEDYDDQMQFYQDTLDEIDEMVSNGSATEFQAQYYRSKLRKPPTFDDSRRRLEEEKIKTERAQRARINRQDRDGGGSGSGDDAPGTYYPELQETVDSFINGTSSTPQASLLAGRTLSDQGDYYFSGVQWGTSPEGDDALVYSFTANPEKMEPAAKAKAISQIKANPFIDQGQKNDLMADLEDGKPVTLPIYVTNANPVAAWFAVLSDSQREKFRDEMNKHGEINANNATAEGFYRWMHKQQNKPSGPLDFSTDAETATKPGTPPPSVTSNNAPGW